MTAAPLLEIENLGKRFGVVEVLKAVTLSIAPGEVVAVCGASGSGKSTLLRCINGLETPSAGRLRFRGADVPTTRSGLRELRRHIGMVFQSFNLFPHLTALQNVALGPKKVLRKSSAEANDLACALLDRVGLADKADAFPDFLSGGQQQRVAIARALAMSPSLMLFDEPTSALDPEMVNEVLDVMGALAAQGMTMIVVSHEMNFAREAADRIAFMHQGAILETAAPDEFFRAPKSAPAQRFVGTVLRQHGSIAGGA
ncbi:MAG TPA: amino acid ABC transporter ATP-binding protein [Pseudolabrys sp.]|nr:amino acid ABC transporter ATP-binding protein [Pseudolabrys sp.]